MERSQTSSKVHVKECMLNGSAPELDGYCLGLSYSPSPNSVYLGGRNQYKLSKHHYKYYWCTSAFVLGVSLPWTSVRSLSLSMAALPLISLGDKLHACLLTVYPSKPYNRNKLCLFMSDFGSPNTSTSSLPLLFLGSPGREAVKIIFLHIPSSILN